VNISVNFKETMWTESSLACELTDQEDRFRLFLVNSQGVVQNKSNKDDLELESSDDDKDSLEEFQDSTGIVGSVICDNKLRTVTFKLGNDLEEKSEYELQYLTLGLKATCEKGCIWEPIFTRRFYTVGFPVITYFFTPSRNLMEVPLNVIINIIFSQDIMSSDLQRAIDQANKETKESDSPVSKFFFLRHIGPQSKKSSTVTNKENSKDLFDPSRTIKSTVRYDKYRYLLELQPSKLLDPNTWYCVIFQGGWYGSEGGKVVEGDRWYFRTVKSAGESNEKISEIVGTVGTKVSSISGGAGGN